MLDEITLHIGMHKTGSSSIQAAMQGYDDHSLPLNTLFDPNPELIEPHVSMGRSAASVEQMRSTFQGALDAAFDQATSRLLFSAEGVCELPESGKQALRRAFAAKAKSLKVLGYIRHPAAFMESWFAESVKHGLTKFHIANPSYRTLIGGFIDQPEIASSSFVAFEPKKLRDGDLVSDFAHRVGVDHTRLNEAPRKNESLSLEATQALFLLNRGVAQADHGADHVNTLRVLRRQIAAQPGNRFRLDSEILRQAVDPAEMEWLAHHTGIEFAEPPHRADEGPAIGCEEDLLRPTEQTRALITHLAQTNGVSARQKGDPADQLMDVYTAIRKQREGGMLRKGVRQFKKLIGSGR